MLFKKYITNICFLLTFVLISLNLMAQEYVVKQLDRGSYTVGFYSTVAFDYTQNYPFYLDSTAPVKKAPKPLIINVWYPAQPIKGAKPMLWKEYMDVESKDPAISKWLHRFRTYTEEAMLTELLQKSKDKLDATEQKLIDSFLLSPTTVIKKAKEMDKKFPFIIYAQGAGGTIEDNAVFCATLASHGYVVIGSSFQYNKPDYVGPIGPPASTRDIAFVLNYARSLPNVDYYTAGMMGHSLGAQKMISFMAQGNTPFDAVVSLETTQEYQSLQNKLWDYYVQDATRNANEMEGSFLFATDPSAVHMLADQFKSADRHYLTIPGLGHNDYISQGIQKRYFAAQKKATQETMEQYWKVGNGYAQVSNAAIRFFNARLKKDSANWKKMVLASQTTAFGSGMYIEQMAATQTKYAFDPSLKQAPTPRQLKFLVMDGKIDTVLQLLKQYWQKDSKLDIYDATVAYPLIHYLGAIDTLKAIELYKVYTSLIGEKDIDNKFIVWAWIMKTRFRTEDAEVLHKTLYMLNPGNPEKVKQLIDKQNAKG